MEVKDKKKKPELDPKYEFMRWFLSRSPEAYNPARPLRPGEVQEEVLIKIARQHSEVHPNRSDPFAFERMMHYLRRGIEDYHDYIPKARAA